MEENEVQYAIELNKLGYLPGPTICKWGNTKFYIKYDSIFKISHAIFRCTEKKMSK